MRALRAMVFINALLWEGGCTIEPGVPWADAAVEIADAFCARCMPDDALCRWDVRRSLMPLPGQPEPMNVPGTLLDECVGDIHELRSCYAYEMPESCLRLADMAAGR